MPAYTVERLINLIGDLDGLRVVILGASYRGDVKELAFSGVFPLAEELGKKGADVAVNDPLYTDEEIKGLGFVPYRIGEECEAAILQADHKIYGVLNPTSFPGIKAIVDGRGVLDPEVWVDNNVAFAALGRGDLA
jgi:UDP-N-acetyl-D-mannosaminuronate dehydrogenase